MIEKQAESRGLSAFHRLHMQPSQLKSECVRGPSHPTPHPQERASKARGTVCVISPAHYMGRYGRSPVRRGSRRRQAAPAQGKAFPPKRVSHW